MTTKNKSTRRQFVISEWKCVISRPRDLEKFSRLAENLHLPNCLVSEHKPNIGQFGYLKKLAVFMRFLSVVRVVKLVRIEAFNHTSLSHRSSFLREDSPRVNHCLSARSVAPPFPTGQRTRTEMRRNYASVDSVSEGGCASCVFQFLSLSTEKKLTSVSFSCFPNSLMTRSIGVGLERG
jgi:hypothetical protein